MKPDDWYRLRCILLHQGRTRDGKGQSQYDRFRFSHPPEEKPSAYHRRIEKVKNERVIHLDVLALSKEVSRAIQKWFDWIEKDAPSEIVSRIEGNVRELAEKYFIDEFVPSDASLHEGTYTLSVTSSNPGSSQ